jgi:RHS repeat-associated protein
VRRVFASAITAPAFGYDPYGNALQATAPLTDFGYAGMFRNADSGLYLTQYRAYDPAAGRWLSRDPMEEAGDAVGNLYSYVGGNPVSLTDPTGEQGTIGNFIRACGIAIGLATGGPAIGTRPPPFPTEPPRISLPAPGSGPKK